MEVATLVWAQLDAPGPGIAAGLWVLRLLTYLSLTVVVGMLVTATWLLPAPQGGAPAGPMAYRATRWAAMAAGVWAAAAAGLFVFGLANAMARPLLEVLDLTAFGRFLDTRFGRAALLQSMLAVGVAALAAVSRGRRGPRAALVATGLGALALASGGHAATADPPALTVASQAVHIVAVAAWVGGLAVLTVMVLAREGLDAAGPTQRFSRLAGWALATVLATGVVNTLVHVGEPGQLLDTRWGQLAVVKAALFAGIAVLGRHNRRRLVPRIGSGRGPARSTFRRFAAAELGVMVLAFGAATAMASGIPADVEAAGRLQLVRVPFAEGQVELTLAPARADRANELHVYFFDDDGALREVADAAVTLRGEDSTTPVDLARSGTGHYTGLSVQVPQPGAYRLEVEGHVDGTRETATAALTVQ